MSCSRFDRWLDEGMTEPGSAGALAHALECPRCAAALASARAVEAALSASASPARAPADFSSRVMARIDAVEAARRHEAERAPATRWWLAILADPVTSVSMTVALLALTLLIWNPAWVLRLGGWLGANWAAWVLHAGETPVDSVVWLAILAAAAPFALWGVWEVGRKVERAFVLQVTKPAR